MTNDTQPQVLRDGTAQGLLAFLDWAGRRGEMNRTTARSWTSTARSVLDVEGRDLADIDIRGLDADALFSRFRNLNEARFTSGSMGTYRSRFNGAVEAYIKFLDGEDWRPRKGRPKRPAGASATVNPAGQDSKAAPAGQDPQTGSGANGPGASLVRYRLPLRPRLMVELALPADLTRADAERVATFVRSLAFDEAGASGPARSDHDA